MNTAIETDNLVKRCGDVTAVDGLSLRVAKGEIYAFRGFFALEPEDIHMECDLKNAR